MEWMNVFFEGPPEALQLVAEGEGFESVPYNYKGFGHFLHDPGVLQVKINAQAF